MPSFIRVNDKDATKHIIEGNYAFKITTKSGKQIGIVGTYKDYEQKLYSHSYSPLLYAVNFPTRLAYLYGCLNRKLNEKREESFVFMWRKIGTDEWQKWFEVIPHTDES